MRGERGKGGGEEGRGGKKGERSASIAFVGHVTVT